MASASPGELRPILPSGVGIAGGLAAVLVCLPIIGLVAGVSWSSLPALLTSPSALAALWLSLRTAAIATALAVVLGIPLAMLVSRGRFRGRLVLRSVILLPLVLPPVVSGLALLAAFGRQGLIGRHLEVAGIRIAFTSLAVVLAMTFVSLPFLVLSVGNALDGLDPDIEHVAATLGARPHHQFWSVTLPSLRGAIATGAVLTFARALGEFGATLTFAGSLQGVTRTLPLEIYLQREVDPQAAVALSLLLMVVAFVVVVAVYGRRR